MNANQSLSEFVRDFPDFPKEGIIFKDISPLLKNPKAFTQVIDLFVNEWTGKIDTVAALDARGFIFGMPLAQKLAIPFVMIRKVGKLPGELISVSYELEYGKDAVSVQSDAFESKAQVLVIDDFLATGGTARATCDLIEKAGGTVAGCAFFVELAELEGRKKLEQYTIQSIITA